MESIRYGSRIVQTFRLYKPFETVKIAGGGSEGEEIPTAYVESLGVSPALSGSALADALCERRVLAFPQFCASRDRLGGGRAIAAASRPEGRKRGAAIRTDTILCYQN